MKRILLLLILLNFAASKVHSQSFSVNDLVTLASLPSKNIDHFMKKNGFVPYSSKQDGDTMRASFGVKIKAGKKYTGPVRAIDIILSSDSKYFTLRTSLLNEYQDGKHNLVKSGFFYDDKKDIIKEPAMLFLKGNMTIEATTAMIDTVAEYNFKLTARKIPPTIKFAEDLMQFDSHEFLVSFFGAKNVKKDMYYFSDTELRKCSVLFSGTRYQVLFVWEDQNNLNNVSYILIPRVLPTEGADKTNAVTQNNEWKFKNGIYPGMEIRELLRLNEMDFDIYGNKSDLSYMVKPEENGKIDFKKTAVTLSCNSCHDIKMFNQDVVSALDVAKKDLPMYINDVIIYPSH